MKEKYVKFPFDFAENTADIGEFVQIRAGDIIFSGIIVGITLGKSPSGGSVSLRLDNIVKVVDSGVYQPLYSRSN